MDVSVSKKMRNSILLAQTNNIARAAEKIHMTASPFGKSIAALENQVGCTLLTHKDNNISLNEAGQELYQKLFPIYQRPPAIDNEIHNASRRSREIVTGINSAHPTIIFDQLISLGGKYDGMTAQAVEFSKNGVIDNLFDRKLDFIISPQHISPRAQELGDLVISELSPLRLGLLVSRRYEEKRPQDLLHELPWLQVRFQNRASSEAVLDAYMRPCGINPTIIYRPYSFMAKISAIEHGQFLTVTPHFTWRLVNPSTLKHFGAPGSPMYMQEFLYSLKNHRYIATMFQHIAEDRNSGAS